MLLGHVAVSTLLHRYLRVELGPVIWGGIFPDAVDKTLCQGLRITRSGRMYAHTLLSLGLTTLGIRLLGGRQIAWGWGLGYLGHLLADSTGFIPWFYPFRHYRFHQSQATFLSSFSNMFLRPKWLEWVLLIWAIWVCIIEKRR